MVILLDVFKFLFQCEFYDQWKYKYTDLDVYFWRECYKKMTFNKKI